jgi:acyl carrier protein
METITAAQLPTKTTSLHGLAVSPEKIKALIADQLKLELGTLVDSAHFYDDLHVDSLDMTELTMKMEDEYDLKIPDDEARDLKTVGEVVGYVLQRIAALQAQ